jgi:hypothetical protein
MPPIRGAPATVKGESLDPLSYLQKLGRRDHLHLDPRLESRHDPREFPNLNVALVVLRESGIPEYEIRRVTKELAAINGAIVQVPETLIFDHATGQRSPS